MAEAIMADPRASGAPAATPGLFGRGRGGGGGTNGGAPATTRGTHTGEEGWVTESTAALIQTDSPSRVQARVGWRCLAAQYQTA